MASSHEHAHGPSLARAGERHRGRLTMAFAVILAFFVVQVVAAFWTNSLALLSDAGHMLTDVIGLGMALAAIQLATRFAQRPRTTRSTHTFGLYRLEILAAFVNSLLLFGVAIWVVVEAIRRLGDEPEVLGVPMLVVAVLGLIANLVAFMLLREGASESVNVEGAYLEVLADTVGSVGVIAAAVLLQVFGWTWIDSVVGAAIGLWILPRTWRLGRRAVRILLQAAPDGFDLDQLVVDLERDRRCGGCSRPPRLDAHLRDGRSVGASRDVQRCRLPRGARQREAVPRRDVRGHARDLPGRARRPRGM